MRRRSSSFNTARIDDIWGDITAHYGDLTDACSVMRVIDEVRPHEIYNLGAQSHVHVSFENPVYTADVNSLGCLRILETIRFLRLDCKFYQASSSEMYGQSNPPQNEETSFYPKSPYGVSKLAAHWFTVNYRESYGLRASTGILFNHESPVRGETFVTRKVVRGLVGIHLRGEKRRLRLGNLEAYRDWGHARDYVEAMYLIQQHGGDFVIGTGESRSVREFVSEVGNFLGCDPYRYIDFDRAYLRPSEVDYLRADADKARRILGWSPKVDFKGLVREMVEAEIESQRAGRALA